MIIRVCLVLVVVLAACDDSKSPGTEAGVELGACSGEGEICGGMCVNWKWIVPCKDCPQDCSVTDFHDCGDGRCFCLRDLNMQCDAGPDLQPDLQPDTSNLCGPEGEICGGQCVNWKYIMSCADCPKHCVLYWVDCGDGTCYCELTPNLVCDGGPGDGPPDASPDAAPDASLGG